MGNWYVGIDQSYTGFAITFLNPETDEHYSMVKAFKGEGVVRLRDIQRWLGEVFDSKAEPIARVAIEGYSHGSKFGRELSGELGAAVKLKLYALGHPNFMVVPPTALKKFVTGKGNSAKNEMLLHVYKKWGVEFDNDNAADSYALARYAYTESPTT